MPDTPHFQHPFSRTGGKVAVVEQDTLEHVASCEAVIVACPAGFRDDRPDFGIPWPEYGNSVDVSGIEAAVRRLEPRGRTTARELVDLARQAQGEFEIEVEVEA